MVMVAPVPWLAGGADHRAFQCCLWSVLMYHFRLLMGPSALVFPWLSQDPAHDGQFWLPGHLLSHGPVFCLY